MRFGTKLRHTVLWKKKKPKKSFIYYTTDKHWDLLNWWVGWYTCLSQQVLHTEQQKKLSVSKKQKAKKITSDCCSNSYRQHVPAPKSNPLVRGTALFTPAILPNVLLATPLPLIDEALHSCCCVDERTLKGLPGASKSDAKGVLTKRPNVTTWEWDRVVTRMTIFFWFVTYTVKVWSGYARQLLG